MNRAIMILRDSLDWNKNQIERAKKEIDAGCCGPELANYEHTIKENEEHNKDIQEALKVLRNHKPNK